MKLMMITDDAHVFVKLTSNATSYFNNLSSKEKSGFYQNLISQLAEVAQSKSRVQK
jgi:hypothetical protein